MIPQDDTGLVFGGTRASPDVSFKTMVELQRQVATIIGDDPAVVDVGSIVGGSVILRLDQSRHDVLQPEAVGRA